ncbi:MmpS family transport accessory protein [Mycobacterium sp.]|uniref:MmpS family transport accessory protein n=1 Tax=Mycobacterium sp. TaxID=1785 RepID=UPI0025FD90A4|nr:MmpS family transport accessory protein [Mycobacterium sp.]
MRQTSMAKRAAGLWVPVVVVVAVVLGGVAVMRLRGVFGSEGIFSATGSAAAPLTPFVVKTVTYDVDGPPQASGSVSYLDETAQTRQAVFGALPWHVTISTTQPVVIASVVAQSDADQLQCRIAVNGVIHDEQTAAGEHAQTFCLVKAA